MKDYFSLDERLGIDLPVIEYDWDLIPLDTRQAILLNWEKIRGTIPDRIARLEEVINQKQEMLNNESDFEKSCRLNSDISELASIINDLWILFRLHQDIIEKTHQ
jgi:hypothetical protein